jgi:cytosine/adenosine deaminase-related metal-dependent hydrolase
VPSRCRLTRLVLGAVLLAAALSSGAQAARAASPPLILVKHGLIFSLKPGIDRPFEGYLLVGADGKIAAVGPGEPPPATTAVTVIDAQGRFVLPGFLSGHTHVYQGITRGLGVDQTLLGWIKAISALSATSADDRYYATLFGAYDLLRHGITTSFDFNDAMGRPGFDQAGLRAELASGMRFVHAYCLPFQGDAKSRRADFDAFYAYARGFADRPTFLAIALGGYQSFLDDPSYSVTEGEIMREYNYYNEAHFLEPPEADVVKSQQARFAAVVAAGELGPRLSFGHFIHTNDAILAQVAKAGAAMVWNPLSNGRLASGVADIPKYRKLGIRIGMGVDGQASADIADPFENMRMGLYVIRAKYESAAILQPEDVLRFHTLGTADVIGVADRVGSLEPGKFGDFLLVDPASMATGPVYNPCATLVLACDTPNFDQVYVGGRLVVDHGNPTDAAFPAARDEAMRRFTALGKKLAAAPAPATP